MKLETLPTEVVELLTARLKDEYKAFYHYKAASNWCQNVGYFKAAEYFKTESEDELSHAKGIEEFMVQWNVTPDLPEIGKPQIVFLNLKEIIEISYKIEYELYEEYEDTSVKIFKIGDICVFDFLQKYRTIQSTSIAEYSDMLNMLDGVQPDKMNLLLLEKKLFHK